MESTHALERIQREHELGRALDAARTLHERLELAGLADHVTTVHLIRDDLARRIAENVQIADFYREPTQEAFAQIVGDPAELEVPGYVDFMYGKADKGDKAVVDCPPCQVFSEPPIA